MKIVKEDYTFSGTKIQIEDWSQADSNLFPKDSIIGCYPVSKANVKGIWREFYPKRFKRFRYELRFANKEEAETAFNKLVTGEERLIDYINNYHGSLSKEYAAKCLGYNYVETKLNHMRDQDGYWEWE